MVVVSLFTAPKPAEELQGLVYGTTLARHGGAARRGRRRLVPQAGPARLGRDRPRRRSATSPSPSDRRLISHVRHTHPTATSSNEVTELERKSATAARLFDIRRIIGGLFVVYGVIVTIAGITASDADLKKAEDININLWTGLGMLALGLFFLVWLKLRPTAPPTPDLDRPTERPAE